MNSEKLLSKLISYPTISETSNKEIIDFISSYLLRFGIKSKKIEGNHSQYNLYCRIGPPTEGGIMFSGHTDVVPVEGQKWSKKPFKLTSVKNKLYGRGTSDMKGFIAVVLSIIPKIKIKELKKPIHLVFSYDEEIGCVGIQKLIPFFKKISPKPKFCIVGEPTEMKLINQHKGKKNFSVIFNGLESHSSLINDGVNAINYSAEFIKYLETIQNSLKKKNCEKSFYPEYPTINVGTISGGVAVNIIPNKCEIEFEIRDTPKLNTRKLLKKIEVYLKKLQNKMKKKSPLCSIKITQKNNFPPLKTNQNKEIISLCLNSLKANSLNTVSFGTEAGVFNDLGFQTVVCGPGSIKQAHKPDEFIEKKQMVECHFFLEEIVKKLY